ncbi:hypothetical protein [Streptomyces xanthophaeus]
MSWNDVYSALLNGLLEQLPSAIIVALLTTLFVRHRRLAARSAEKSE